MSEIKKITNISEEDFVGMYTGTSYSIKAKDSLILPKKIALHLADQLAHKILQKRNDKRETDARERHEKDMTPFIFPIENEEKASLASSLVVDFVKVDEPKPVAKVEVQTEPIKEFEDLPKKKTRKKK